MQMPIETVSREPSRLGECPIWCHHTQVLWWVDVLEPIVWRYDIASGTCSRHEVRARRIGSLALRQNGGLLLACDDGLHAYNPETGEQRLILDPEPHCPDHRKNDGRVDWAGNFWVGTLSEREYAPVGSIFRVCGKDRITRVTTDMSIPNAIAFDQKRGRVYYADTRAFTIWMCDYDAENGAVGPPKVFARTRPPGRPDGSCVDAEGYVWNALYAGGAVVRYSPDGEIAQVIDLPVSHPTCCSFGGPELDRLFITSAFEPLSEAERQNEPLAGHTLVMSVGVKGRREYLTHL